VLPATSAPIRMLVARMLSFIRKTEPERIIAAGPKRGHGVSAQRMEPLAAAVFADGLDWPRATSAQDNRNGSVRSRFPVAANTALATAGAMGGVPVSPMPPGFSELATIFTTISGISAMRKAL